MKFATLMICGLVASVSMGADILPNNVGMPMRHVMISLTDDVLDAHVDDADTPTILERFPGETYIGAAGVLDGMAYGDQYGWLADGFIDPGFGSGITIELVAATDGLETYEGGLRMMKANHTYDAIFGTEGSDTSWDWPGTMFHNWYAALENGEYEATYRVFVSDINGDQVAGTTEDFVTLKFLAVPTPSSALVLGFGGLGVLGIARRRRGGHA